MDKKYVDLFCYGLLKSGYQLSNQMEKAGGVFIAPCKVRGYTLYETYGVAVMSRETDAGYWVEGELWSIPTDILPMLDRIEGGYDRVSVQVEGVYGDKTPAFAYVDHEPQPWWRWVGPIWGT